MVYTPVTQINDDSVNDFLNNIEDLQKREDSFALLDLFSKISGEQAKMWGSAIVGFGSYSYASKSCAGNWMRAGFSPRKNALSIYIMPGYNMGMESLLEKLGKHKMGKSCLTIKKLTDIDLGILGQVIQKGLDIMDKQYPKQ